MKNSRKLQLSTILGILFLFTGNLLAQTQQKLEKSYPVNGDVAVNIDAQHTKLVFQTWDRNELGIEAYIDTQGLSEEEITAALEGWQVRIKGDKSAMNISSKGTSSWNGVVMPSGMKLEGMDSLRVMTAKMTSEMIGPLMENLVGPMLESFSDNPLPPEFTESIGSIHFDHEAYERDGEKYLKEWEKELESKFGDDFEAAMEEWGKNFEKDSAKWGAEMEVEMEAWGKEFEKDMEKWAEKFGSDMEAWGENFGKEMEKWAEEMESENGSKTIIIRDSDNSKAKRTMIIKIPQEAKLDLDVRHGEIQLANRTNNLRADISHSKLMANTITGAKTVIEASYTPVKVKNWEYGVLNTNYVQNCSIEEARSLKLNSVSSDVNIGKITDTGILSGTFGSLDINSVSPDFSTLDINLENSELNLDLPETALNFNYSGAQSSIEYPESIEAKPVKRYDNEMINGFQKNNKGAALVKINAKFSEVSIE